uniref:Uncharacterized protein n=1 Tax=Monopterus albus TaxID=43700 RepID=A0A3Q3IGK8_MONAL
MEHIFEISSELVFVFHKTFVRIVAMEEIMHFLEASETAHLWNCSQRNFPLNVCLNILIYFGKKIYKTVSGTLSVGLSECFNLCSLNTNNMIDKRLQNQASNQDYKNTSYDRGHLFPSGHACDINEKISTFTLTNIILQVPRFNQGIWNKMETCVKCVLKRFCSTESYVVTGAMEGKESLKNWVNIPSKLWSAFCCYSQKEKKWLTSAHWGYNSKSQVKYLPTKTLQQLKDELKIQVKEILIF